MLSAAERQRIAINIWTARFMPVGLAGVVGYATYVLVGPLCVDYLLSQHNEVAAAAVILTIYFLLFLFMASALLRLLYTTVVDPCYLPLGPSAIRNRRKYNSEKGKSKHGPDGFGGAEYSYGNNAVVDETLGTKDDPDSPGLELFYTKDVFSCEVDGRPKWCSHCANWKPDRAHHCSDAGRCILKMDHFCPWVGGPVGETNFKFFIQYTTYTALYCLNLLVVMAIYVARQIRTEGETYNRQFAAILGIAIFFFLFTASMSGTSMNLAAQNLTQVERLGSKTRVHTLAIMKPSLEQRQHVSKILASQHQYREVTYPLIRGDGSDSSGPLTTTSEASNLPLGTAPLNESTRSKLPPSSEAPTVQQNSSRIVSQSYPTQNGGTVPENISVQSQSSERDRKATRTFAILNMNQGGNPWDLGSLLLNWESVMGRSVIDWVLPIKRSPCSNHEDTESQFEIGPQVDLLKASVGFIAPEDIRAYGGRRKSERKPVKTPELSSGHEKRRKGPFRRKNNSEAPQHAPVPLEDLRRQNQQHTV